MPDYEIQVFGFSEYVTLNDDDMALAYADTMRERLIAEEEREVIRVTRIDTVTRKRSVTRAGG